MMQYLTQLILTLLLLWNVTVSEGGSVGIRRQVLSPVHSSSSSSSDDSPSNTNSSPQQGKSVVISRPRRSSSLSLESPVDRPGGIPSSWSDDNSEVIGIVVEPTSKQQLDNDNENDNDNSGNRNMNRNSNDEDGDGDEEILEEETAPRHGARDEGILSQSHPSLLLYSSLPALSSSFPASSQHHSPTRGVDTASLAKLKPKTSMSFSPVGERILEISAERRRRQQEQEQEQNMEEEMMKSHPNANIYTNNNNIHNARGHMQRILSRNARDNSFNEDIRRHLLSPPRFNFVVPSSAFRTAKRSTNCLRKCMSMGFLHPSQCHSLC